MSFVSSVLQSPVSAMSPWQLVETGQTSVNQLVTNNATKVPIPNQGDGAYQTITALTGVLQQVITSLASIMSTLVQLLAGRGAGATETPASKDTATVGGFLGRLTEGVLGLLGDSDNKNIAGFGDILKNIGKKALPLLTKLF